MSQEIFLDAVRSTGDRAGVFEYDGDTAYFYLYDPERPAEKRVVDTLHVFSGVPDIDVQAIAIRWDRSEQMVGLFIHERLWAVFEHDARKKYGGDYDFDGAPDIPVEIAQRFDESKEDK